jgi:hypothetical protein
VRNRYKTFIKDFVFRISNSKSNIEANTPTKEETVPIINSHEESFIDTTSSNNYLYEFEKTLSSSSLSELNLSIAFQSFNDLSSLSLTVLDSQQESTTDEEENSLLTPIQLTSDNESVLYLRLSDELNIIEATLDSDLDRRG